MLFIETMTFFLLWYILGGIKENAADKSEGANDSLKDGDDSEREAFIMGDDMELEAYNLSEGIQDTM